MDDAELLKDQRGLGKPPFFDRNDTHVSFFPASEDDSILFCVTWMTWWIRVQTSVTDTVLSEKWTTR